METRSKVWRRSKVAARGPSASAPPTAFTSSPSSCSRWRRRASQARPLPRSPSA